jgi:hypothetical protein
MMSHILDAFWRAAAYCLHPRVIALSLLPLVIMIALALGLGYFFWTPTIAWINEWLSGSDWLRRGIEALDGVGFGSLKAAIAPLILVLLATPVLIVLSLLAVAFMMTPAMVSLVAERRFAKLERKKGASIVVSVLWSLGSTVLALIALVASVPLWVIPPLILVLPPLIWGWLTYRVMTFDALADHASTQERRAIMKEHRMPLFAIGVVCGYLGAAPTLIWASGVLTLVLAPFLAGIAIWLYTLVFAFSSLWFAHYGLAMLHARRLKVSPNFTEKQPSAHMEIASPAIISGANEALSNVSPKSLPPHSSTPPGTP